MAEQVRERKPKPKEGEKPRHPLLERMEAKRKELGLSIEKFAVKELGVTFQTYHRWLHRRFNPTLEMIERIEKVIGKNGGSGSESGSQSEESDRADPS